MTTPCDPAEYAATAEFYDHVVPYQERADVSFFVQAALASGGPVLEVGCGTGRMLIPTARAGYVLSPYGSIYPGELIFVARKAE